MADRAMDRKWVAEPYDMDTALGINNSGVLMFGYSLEDTDTVDVVISGEEGSSANVYNAQESVLWQNLRDSFRSEIVKMYRSLRAGTTDEDGKTVSYWNYDYIRQWFEDHQSKWPEALFNEDARIKYLDPLINPVTYDANTKKYVRTDYYLHMLQGSKAEQRKWWLYNSFRYLDSKYNTGDALKTIFLRLFNAGTLTLTPAIDLYVGVSFGGGTTPQLKRTTAETPQSFTYESASGVTEMETWIYSADLITDVGDLSVFYPNELNFSQATRLRRLKIGSSEEGYENNNLISLNVQNSVLLEYIDVRNCPKLNIAVNLENSARLKEAYFEGTSITGVDLADGATVETLHLPSTIKRLVLTNLNKLTDLQIPDMSNITTVMLSNMDSSIIDPMDVLAAVPAGTQIYIDGLDITLAGDAEIQEFIDFLDTMKGVTRTRGANGDWMYNVLETAQVSGVIHVDTTTGAMARQLKDKYPYITLDFKHISCTVTFHNYDGTSVLQTKTSNDGAAVTYTGSTPTKPQSASHTFTFSGWAYQIDGVKNDNALKNVTEDRDLYPAFTSQLRTFTVTFKNWDNSTLQTVNNVTYGSDAEYTGSTPTNNSSGDTADFEFIGWNPEPINIVGPTTCVAQFKDVSSIVYKLLNGKLTEIDDQDSLIETVGYGAFAYCSNLTSVNLPVAREIKNFAFMYANKLQSFNLPNVEVIEFNSFTNCSAPSLGVTLSLPSVKTLPNSSFGTDRKFTHYVFDSVEAIPSSCFYGNTTVISVSAQKVTSIGQSAFKNCSELQTIDMSNIENIDNSGFSSCNKLASISLEKCTFIGEQGLSGTKIKTISLPLVTSIKALTFSNCDNLMKIDLGTVTSIHYDRVFQYCSKLEKLIIRTPDVIVSLGSGTAFSSCPNVSIYVPDNLVNSYKEATNWSNYANNIKPLSEVNAE